MPVRLHHSDGRQPQLYCSFLLSLDQQMCDKKWNYCIAGRVAVYAPDELGLKGDGSWKGRCWPVLGCWWASARNAAILEVAGHSLKPRTTHLPQAFLQFPGTYVVESCLSGPRKLPFLLTLSITVDVACIRVLTNM